jgi:DNA-binding response OmpR family regulator/HPt (histidine-containing phosphotransfer) domain-containing protein
MKILLIEDDPSTRKVLINTLATQRYVVEAVADGADGFDLASRWPYDLLIIDWLLPSMNGLEVCRRLREQGNTTPILMLTVRDRSKDIVAGLDAGADDYLAKSNDLSQLLARVRALLRRSYRTPTPLLRWDDLCLDPALTQVTYQQRPVPCRPKEYELLELFLRNPQRLLTRSTIINHLWPMDDAPVEGSVTNLMKDLRRRLKASGLPTSPIETVYGLGYRLKLPPRGESTAHGAVTGNTVTAAPFPSETTPSPRSTTHFDRVMAQATQRFQASLEERLRLLEGAIQAVEEGTASPQQRQLASSEAHKLAGGLGLFGYTQAAAVAATIEQMLYLNQPSPLLTQRLEELKQALC